MHPLLHTPVYARAAYKKSNKTIEGWKEREPFILKFEQAIPTKKTSNLAVLQTHVIYVFPVMDSMLQWYTSKPFRKLKLRRYITANKALREICRLLTGKTGSDTLIGFGDWSNKDSAGVIKKKPAGPVKRLESALSERCRVVAVNEFRTSKIHHECGCVLKHRQCHVHRKKSPDFAGGELMGERKVHSVLFA